MVNIGQDWLIDTYTHLFICEYAYDSYSLIALSLNTLGEESTEDVVSRSHSRKRPTRLSFCLITCLALTSTCDSAIRQQYNTDVDSEIISGW